MFMPLIVRMIGDKLFDGKSTRSLTILTFQKHQDQNSNSTKSESGNHSLLCS